MVVRAMTMRLVMVVVLVRRRMMMGRGGGGVSSSGGSGGLGLGLGMLSCGRDLPLDVFQSLPPIGMEIWVTKSPAVVSKLVIVYVLDLVKVVLVQLAYKGSKVGVFEHSWEDGFGEFVHVFDDEAIAGWTP